MSTHDQFPSGAEPTPEGEAATSDTQAAGLHAPASAPHAPTAGPYGVGAAPYGADAYPSTPPPSAPPGAAAGGAGWGPPPPAAWGAWPGSGDGAGGAGWSYGPSFASPQPEPPASNRRSRRRRAGAAAATAGVVAVAGLGVVVGHVAWGTSSPARAAVGSTGSGSTGSGSTGSGSTGSGSTGSGSTGSGSSPFGSSGSSPFGSSGSSPFGSSGSTSSGSSTSTASGSPANVTAIAKSVDPGLVDIDTSLGYQDAEAAGTGMVLTSTGEILTNNHVIDGATSIKVTDLGNGKTYSATVVGYDRTQDVAVLQLTGASGLKTVTLGNSSSVKAGEGIVGIGNAGGTGGTPSVAGGSVTDLNRTITASDEGSGTSEQLQGLIETNAAIEPGDSGGPLVNAAGQVVGMDTAALTGSVTTSASSSTEGFSIPINEAVSIAKQIESGKATSVVHIGATAFLGVEVEGASSAEGGYGAYGGFGSGGTGSTTSGAIVAGVASGTPAASAGLAEGDVITAVNGRAVASPTALTQDLVGDRPGTTVQLTYTDSSGQSHAVSVKLASGPPQ